MCQNFSVGCIFQHCNSFKTDVKDPTVLSNIKFSDPFFGDLILIEFEVNATKSKLDPVKRRDWRNYSKEILNIKLSSTGWNIAYCY